jgi:hypothetical protein
MLESNRGREDKVNGWKCFVLVIIFLIPIAGSASSELRVPFLLRRNVIIVPTSINGAKPLDLILDTGLTFDGVYLFNAKLLQEMESSKLIEVRVPGAGDGEASTALMIEDGVLSFGDVTVDSQRVIISTSDFTQNFSSDGVIGWNLFGHYIVAVDYDSETMTLYDPETILPDSGWQTLPIILKKNIPFVDGRVEVKVGQTTDVVLYIDLASDKALEMLTGAPQKFDLPDSLRPSYLGTGLSGDIRGSYGKSCHLWLGDHMLSNLPTAFAPREVRSRQEGADGIIGNDCIRRFNVIFDYPHERLLLKPSKYYADPFESD